LNGTFEWRTKSAGSYTFKLFTQSVLFDFLIYRTKEDQWIIEYQGEDTEAIFNNDYTHMLASQVKEVPEGGDWQFEVKWDGIRAFLVLKGETVTIKSRSGRDITHLFPEITEAAHHLKCHTAILDGEIVVLDKVGRSVFKNVMSRMHTKGVKRIKQLSRAMPATLYLFDTVFVDGVDVRETILKLRQKWLRQIVARPGAIRAAEALYEGLALYHAAEKMGLEGIIAKRILSKYQMGTRSPDWVKIKFHSTAECIILGFTAGEGNRSTYFGSLHLGQYEGLKLVYRGRVGTGFDSTSLKECYHILSVIPTTKKPFKEIIQEEKATTWIEPRLKCEIQYASMTDNGSFREPVFIKLLDGGNV
jgi:bifunctional non-homologous end joining protein LigD